MFLFLSFNLMSMSVSTESSGFLCSWKTSSRRMYALGWRKWREVQSTPRRPPCWRWEPISSASRPSRRGNWLTWKLRWARWETLSRSRCPRVARRQPAKIKNDAKTKQVCLQILDEWPIKCKSDVTRRGILPSQKMGGRMTDALSWAPTLVPRKTDELAAAQHRCAFNHAAWFTFLTMWNGSSFKFFGTSKRRRFHHRLSC